MESKRPARFRSISPNEELLGNASALAALCALILPGLGRSLWIDELGTWFVVSGSAAQVIERAVEIQGQSPFYYLVVHVFTSLLGASEAVLRLPSFLAGLASVTLIPRLARRFGLRTGWPAALIFACSPAGEWAGHARPYALVLFLGLLSSVALERWRETPARGRAIAYGISMLAVIYAHYLGALLIVPHIVRLAQRGAGARRDLWIISATLAIGAVPLFSQLSGLAGKAGHIDFGRGPRLQALAAGLFPLELIAALLIALVVLKPPIAAIAGALRKPGIVYLVVWGAAIPVLLFIASHLLDLGLFAPRYFAVAAIAQALVTATLLCALPRKVRFPAIISVAALAAALGPVEAPEGWREARDVITADGSACPVLMISGLSESNSPTLRASPEYAGFIEAPLRYYTVHPPVHLIPPGIAPAVNKESIDAELRVLMRHGCVWFIFRRLAPAGASEPYVSERFTSSGWKIERKHEFGHVGLTLFRR